MEQLSDNFEVSVSFVDNKEIREINREFRNIDSETDVLSFLFSFIHTFPPKLLRLQIAFH